MVEQISSVPARGPLCRARITRTHLCFVVSFLPCRASLAFASAHPLDRCVAEQHVVWPSSERVEAYHCSKHTFQMPPDSALTSSSSSDDEDEVNGGVGASRPHAAVHRAGRWRRHAHTISLTTRSVPASSTEWLRRRAENLIVLSPLCGIRVGDHIIALLPTSPEPPRPAARRRHASGWTVRTHATDASSDGDDDDDGHSADGRWATPTAEEAQWGPAVNVRDLDEARQCLQNALPFASTPPRTTGTVAIHGPDLVRVVYWEPCVEPAADAFETAVSDESPMSVASLKWSLWWFCRGELAHVHAAQSDTAIAQLREEDSEADGAYRCGAAAVPSAGAGSAFLASGVTSSSSYPPSSCSTWPLSLHVRSATLGVLRQALALTVMLPRDRASPLPPPSSSTAVCLSQLLTSLYVRLSASAEWVSLVDVLSGHRPADDETVRAWECAGGLVDPPVAVLEALHNAEVPPSLDDALPSSAAPTNRTSLSRLARVVVVLPIREQGFIVRWRDHQRRSLRHGEPHAATTTAAIAPSVFHSDGDRASSATNATSYNSMGTAARIHTSLASQLTCLREFDGSDGFLTDVNALGELPCLEMLLLPNNRQLRDDGICGLGEKSTSLRLVDLTGCTSVGDAGAVAVASIPTMEALSLMHTAITDACVPLLVAQASRRLRRLAVDHCTQLSQTHLLARSLPALEWLSAERCRGSAAHAAAGGGAAVGGEHLTHLSVSHSTTLTDGRPWLFSFPQLTFLDLSFTRIDDLSLMHPGDVVDGVEAEDGATSGATVSVRQPTLPRPCASVGRHHPLHLQTLSVEGCHGLTDLGPLGHLPALRVLRAGRTSVRAAGLTGLARCRWLEEVDLALCTSLEGISPLAEAPSLKVLNLFGCESLTDDGLAPIAATTTLRQLYLMGCRRLRNVAFLGQLPALRRLSLRDTGVLNSALQGMASAFAQGGRHRPTPRLTQLDVAECMGISEWPAGCASGLPHLRRLEMEFCELRALPQRGFGPHVRVCTVSGNGKLTELLPALSATPSVRQVNATALSLSAEALATDSLPTSVKGGVAPDDLPPSQGRAQRQTHSAYCESAVPQLPYQLPTRRHALRTLDLTHCEALHRLDALALFPKLAALNVRSTGVTDDTLAAYTGAAAGTPCPKMPAGAICGTCRRVPPHTPLSSHAAPRADLRPPSDSAVDGGTLPHRALRALSVQQCRGVFSTRALTASVCPHLHTLILSESNVNDEGLVFLAQCVSLIVVKLDGCKGVSQLAPLACLPRLEEIHANGTNVTTAGLAGLAWDPSATAADSHTPCACPRRREAGRGVQSCRARAPALRYLSICGCPMIFNGFAPLGDLPHLQVLNMGNCRNLVAAHFTELRTLQRVRDSRASAQKLTCPRLFPRLEILDVSRCALLEGSLDGLETMTHLREVYTSGTPLAELTMPAPRRLLLVDGAL